MSPCAHRLSIMLDTHAGLQEARGPLNRTGTQLHACVGKTFWEKFQGQIERIEWPDRENRSASKN
jgi:hypothetical protein